MIGIKLVGSLLILAAGGFASLGCVSREKKRPCVLDAWIELLSFIRGQIDLYLMPMDGILSHVERDLLERLGVSDRPGSLRACLESALPYLDNESQRLLLIWCRECGSGYRDEELRRCDHTLQSLREHRSRLSSALPSRLKLTVARPLCLSLGTAILLW